MSPSCVPKNGERYNLFCIFYHQTRKNMTEYHNSLLTVKFVLVSFFAREGELKAHTFGSNPHTWKGHSLPVLNRNVESWKQLWVLKGEISLPWMNPSTECLGKHCFISLVNSSTAHFRLQVTAGPEGYGGRFRTDALATQTYLHHKNVFFLKVATDRLSQSTRPWRAGLAVGRDTILPLYLFPKFCRTHLKWSDMAACSVLGKLQLQETTKPSSPLPAVPALVLRLARVLYTLGYFSRNKGGQCWVIHNLEDFWTRQPPISVSRLWLNVRKAGRMS